MTRSNLLEKTEIKKVPESLKEYMRERFMLRPEYIDGLRCFEQEGTFYEEAVTQVRIFNLVWAKKLGLSIRDGSDLERHPEVLVFDGYINRAGKVRIVDRRVRGGRRSQLILYPAATRL